MRPDLTEREYRLFREWLSEEFGLCFGPAKRDILRSRLEPRRVALGLDTFEQLYFHVKFHPERERERDRLVPHLTNNESYFFRESGQLDVLRDELLPRIRDRLEQEGRRELRLLSAGCAAGEEPYTLAMLVHESTLFPSPWKVRITGVDLDPEALQRAREARYTQNAFRRLDEARRARHFEPEAEGSWRLKPEIRSVVRFQLANLVGGEWWRGLPAQDVIFCRNVLIYFDDENIRRTVEGFYEALIPGGHLFLGHAESLSRIPTRFAPMRRPGAVFYQRPEDG